jgi:hypothetical protein
VRALRRGHSLRLGIAIGLVGGVLPLMKGTGYELFPALVVAIALIAVRGLGDPASRLMRGLFQRGASAVSSMGGAVVSVRRMLPSRLIAAAAGVLAFMAVTFAWAQVAPGFNRGGALGGVSPTGVVAGGGQLGGHIVYLWETFLPRLPFMAQHWSRPWPFYDIYVKRGFGAFGWYAIFFNEWVYQTIVGVMAVVLAGILAALVRYRRAVLSRWRELLVLALIVLGVFGGVEYVYYSTNPRPDLPEQGRYAFPAIAALAALAVFGTLGFGRRVQTYALSMLVTAMIGLAVASHVLYIAARYT